MLRQLLKGIFILILGFSQNLFATTVSETVICSQSIDTQGTSTEEGTTSTARWLDIGSDGSTFSCDGNTIERSREYYKNVSINGADTQYPLNIINNLDDSNGFESLALHQGVWLMLGSNVSNINLDSSSKFLGEYAYKLNLSKLNAGSVDVSLIGGTIIKNYTYINVSKIPTLRELLDMAIDSVGKNEDSDNPLKLFNTKLKEKICSKK